MLVVDGQVFRIGARDHGQNSSPTVVVQRQFNLLRGFVFEPGYYGD